MLRRLYRRNALKVPVRTAFLSIPGRLHRIDEVTDYFTINEGTGSTSIWGTRIGVRRTLTMVHSLWTVEVCIFVRSWCRTRKGPLSYYTRKDTIGRTAQLGWGTPDLDFNELRAGLVQNHKIQFSEICQKYVQYVYENRLKIDPGFTVDRWT